MARSRPHIEKRRAILLEGLDVAKLVGLEIGPLDAPIVPKSAGRIRYVDHATTEGLREKYRGRRLVEVDEIAPVDIVWGDAALTDLVDEQSIDYAIASHVAEHVPDLVTWMQEMKGVLRRDGQLRLLLPDGRVSADCLRDRTRVVDLLDAHLNRARKPRTRQILDHALSVATGVDARKIYTGEMPLSAVSRAYDPMRAIDIARAALETGQYVDVHCWVFTPRSFAEAMRTLVELEVIAMRCAGFHDTDLELFEFYVFLQPCDDKAVAADSWRRMQELCACDLPGSAAEAAHTGVGELGAELARVRAQATMLAEEKRVILNSTIWRATRPLRRIARAVPAPIRRWLHEMRYRGT